MRLESNTTLKPKMRLLYPPAMGVLTSVSEDAVVYAVQEGDALNAEGTADHRYQVLFIPMGNVVSTFYTDMGPSADYVMEVDETAYPTPPYFQIVLMEHTVDECRDMADDFREDDFAAQLLHTQTNESDIIERYWQLIEEDRSIVINKSTFGPGGHIQRNSYSNAGASLQRERLAEKGKIPQHGYYR